MWKLSFDAKAMAAQSVLTALENNPNVAMAQFNYVVELRNATTPNDQHFPDQWAFNNTGQTGGTPDADIDAPEAWDIETDGTTAEDDQIVVAVIDGGFDIGHGDIDYWTNPLEVPNDGDDDDGNGYVDDYYGWNAYNSTGNISTGTHGTRVASIAAATGDNSTGISGVIWGAQVMPIVGLPITADDASVIEAYQYALDQRIAYKESHGARGAFVVVTNSSFGTPGNPADHQMWCEMYDNMGDHGILSVSAAPNKNIDVDANPDMPTSCNSDYLITVTSTTDTDARYSGHAYGFTTVDLGAPGVDILSLPYASLPRATGTSFATPQVAGTVALLVSELTASELQDYKSFPSSVALDLRDHIFNGTDVLNDLKSTTRTGGRLNVYQALQQLNSGDGDDDPPGGGESCVLAATISSDTTVENTCTVKEKTTVTFGATLTIQPGVTLQFEIGAKIKVDTGAKIVADGTADSPIVFNKKSADKGWKKVVVRGDGSRFDHVKIQNAGVGCSSGNRCPALQIEAQNVNVSNATFSDNASDAIKASATPSGQHSSFTLSNSTVKNNDYGLFVYDADVTLTGNTIRDNEYLGVHLGSGVTASLQYNTIKNNGLEGVNIYGATVDHFAHNTIRNNGQYGLDVGFDATVYLGGNSQNRIFNNDHHEVQTDSGHELYLGDASIGEGGYNEIYDNGEGFGSGHRYVKNLGSATVSAEMNDWSGPYDETATSAMFSGPVDYEPFVTPPLSASILCNDGSDYNSCTAYASGGGGSYTYDWSGAAAGCTSRTCTATCESTAYVTVTSATGATASDQASTGMCAPDDGGGGECPPGEICVATTSTQEPYSTLNEQALQREIDATAASLRSDDGATSSPSASATPTGGLPTAGRSSFEDETWLAEAGPAQRLHRLYSLLLLKSRVEQVRRGNRTAKTDAFAADRSQMRSLFAGFAETGGSGKRGGSSAGRKASDAARQILVENLLRSGRPGEALQSAKNYASGLSTKKARARMHLQRAMAFEQKGQFKQALQAVDQAERQWPEGDYASLRMMLLRRSGDPRWKDLAKQRKRQASSANAAPASATSAGKAQTTKALPQAFALGAPYPNPTGGRVTVPLALPERAEVRAAVYDVLGRRVAVPAARSFAPGERDLAFSTENLSSGLYLIRVEVEAASGNVRTFTEEVTVVR